MLYLLDTNILLRLATPSHPTHSASVTLTQSLARAGDTLYVLPQNIIEFWSVATRPAGDNGLAMTTTQAEGEVIRIKNLFRLLPDSPAIYPEWENLVVRHAVMGKKVHDTRLVAAMLVYGITHIVTFDRDGFKRFPGITAVSP